MPTDDVTLLPCPFCGKADLIRSYIVGVRCLTCNASGPTIPSSPGSDRAERALWNRRAVDHTRRDSTTRIERAPAPDADALQRFCPERKAACETPGECAGRESGCKMQIRMNIAPHTPAAEPCCGEWFTCQKPCTPRADRWREARNDELRNTNALQRTIEQQARELAAMTIRAECAEMVCRDKDADWVTENARAKSAEADLAAARACIAAADAMRERMKSMGEFKSASTYDAARAAIPASAPGRETE